MVEKVDSLSHMLMQQQRAKRSHGIRLQKIEDCYIEFLSLTQFREQSQLMETRLLTQFEDKLDIL